MIEKAISEWKKALEFDNTKKEIKEKIEKVSETQTYGTQ